MSPSSTDGKSYGSGARAKRAPRKKTDRHDIDSYVEEYRSDTIFLGFDISGSRSLPFTLQHKGGPVIRGLPLLLLKHFRLRSTQGSGRRQLLL
jgi:hypothetical protein